VSLLPQERRGGKAAQTGADNGNPVGHEYSKSPSGTPEQPPLNSKYL
jgi:hypothetical protein